MTMPTRTILVAGSLLALSACGENTRTTPDQAATPDQQPAAEAQEAPAPEATAQADGVAVSTTEGAGIVLGYSGWDGPADCTAEGVLTRTDEALVVTVQVVDDEIWTGSTTPHLSDSVEVYMDLRADDDRGSPMYAPGVFQAIIVPGFDDDEASVAFHGANQTYDAKVPGATVTSSRTDTGYQVQLTLPLEGLQTNHFTPGEQVGFVVGVNDADGGPRETQLMTAGTDRNWEDPSFFAVVEL